MGCGYHENLPIYLGLRIPQNVGSRPEWRGKTVIVYDGDCPFCSKFVKFQRLRSAIGEVILIDARSDPGLVVAFQSRGMSLDDG
ncbi:DCC1-like thiol-disulfide oxidoreductase family protein, partial [Rhizobium johnstonii]|uniref:DCC1-like thiol-disulfide oxidoreductase family protein n=1 Tax=Rhizobium johnstonii TaxID=3019933 RepID=UPI003F970F5F